MTVISAFLAFGMFLGLCVMLLKIAHPTKTMRYWIGPLFVSQETRDEQRAYRDGKAEIFGGYREAIKTHYWNGTDWVGGKAPSHRDK